MGKGRHVAFTTTGVSLGHIFMKPFAQHFSSWELWLTGTSSAPGQPSTFRPPRAGNPLLAILYVQSIQYCLVIHYINLTLLHANRIRNSAATLRNASPSRACPVSSLHILAFPSPFPSFLPSPFLLDLKSFFCTKKLCLRHDPGIALILNLEGLQVRSTPTNDAQQLWRGYAATPYLVDLYLCTPSLWLFLASRFLAGGSPITPGAIPESIAFYKLWSF